ncbi:DUF418 domain-containing protein [Silvibacterium dinghuense]|uniref:DUF418 domain-containing protein n=1 Tax=Silvibacterium dinghuense TaxID=1560006 RepID=A0A4Q1SGV4_9BACT|nr:DUF418 domain-containing protein [Silvibacterium dinghuense]RXS96585.1 DUF418 domain-containing protein [Silvibacterium dinghuense]GGG92026.1 hypothetical protein GCM10011586_03330 [Silvibacterium dinghuense]
MSSASTTLPSEIIPTSIPAVEVSAPVALGERIASIDVMRGVALLGILAMNIQDFSMIGSAYLNPTTYGDLQGWNYAVWIGCYLLAELKFMSIFSMLFGAGVLLMTSRIEAKGRPSAAIHYRRMGWLALFGCLHGYLLWPGDILFTYALGGAAVYLARKRKARTLIVSGLLVTAVASVLYAGSYETLPYWPKPQVQQMEESFWHPSPEAKAKELATYRAGWRVEEPDRIKQEIAMQVQGNLFMAFWRAYGLMLVGMGLFTLGVFSAKLPARVYGWFIASGVLIGLPMVAMGVHEAFAHGWTLRQGFFLDSQWNYWGSLPVCLFWIGLVMLACQKGWVTGARRRLAAVGRMAFSNYIFDTVLCTFLFYGWGLGLFGKVSRMDQFGIVVAIWAVQLLVSPLWLQRFRFGPLEWMWRSLTYWKMQPMRWKSTPELTRGEV